MAENLKTTLYSNNTAIPNVTLDAAWSVLTTPAYSWLDNDMATNKPLYGAMYNWYAVSTDLICPTTNWHVASDVDFNTLELHLGMVQTEVDKTWAFRGTDQGDQMKSTTLWPAGQDGTNTSGWTALPGGYRYYVNGTFNGAALLSFWWTSSELDATRAWYRELDGPDHGVYKAGVEKQAGKYVRCVHD
jgi:uncharacterized protein (TIGR02145 family)